jgi:dTDP-4-amino-4,6-dideoxygalactose transaminase
MKENGIDTLIHYPVPIHLQQAYASLNIKPGTLPITERAAAEVVSLPMYPQLSMEQINRVVEAGKKFSNGTK